MVFSKCSFFVVIIICVFHLIHAELSNDYKLDSTANGPSDAEYSVNKMFFASVRTSYSLRSGSYDLSGNETYRVYKNGIQMWGFSLGKRVPFLFKTRLHLPISLDYGSSIEDTVDQVPLEDGTTKDLLLKASYYHVGIIPEWQIPIRITPDFALFLAAGGGFHYMKYIEDEFISGEEQVRIIDSYLQNDHTFSFSADAGAGFELLVQNRFAVSLQYSFRYWNPVEFTTMRDLFPYQPVKYKENHATHIFQLILLR